MAPRGTAGASAVRRLVARVVVVVGASAVFAAALASLASAATYTHECDPLDTNCLVLAERLEALEAAISGGVTVQAPLDVAVQNWPPAAEPSTTEVAGVVELSEIDRQNIALTWAGIFMLSGLTVGLVFGRLLWGELRRWFHLPSV